MEKWEILIDGKDKLKVDEIIPEFAIQDSKASGRGEDLIMFREILGGINKFTCTVNFPSGEQLRILRSLTRKPIVTIDIYNGTQGIRRNMKASVKCEKIPILLLPDGEYGDGAITVSFTQTGKDNV